MKVEISVFDPNEDQFISFSDYQFTHIGCGPMSSRSVTSVGESFLQCSCGLEIHLPRNGSAELAISRTVIDGQSRDLESDSFHSNLANAVQVHAHGMV